MAGIDEQRPFVPVGIAVLTVSDTRTLADDQSGDTLAARIAEAGHRLVARAIVPDDKAADRRTGQGLDGDRRHRRRHHHRRHRLYRPRRDAGGAGAAVRKAHGRLFGGLPPHFLRQDRHLDDPVASNRRASPTPTFIFVLPGSPGACKDAWDGILKEQLDYRHMPCNFVEIMPRLDEHLKRGATK